MRSVEFEGAADVFLNRNRGRSNVPGVISSGGGEKKGREKEKKKSIGFVSFPCERTTPNLWRCPPQPRTLGRNGGDDGGTTTIRSTRNTRKHITGRCATRIYYIFLFLRRRRVAGDLFRNGVFFFIFHDTFTRLCCTELIPAYNDGMYNVRNDRRSPGAQWKQRQILLLLYTSGPQPPERGRAHDRISLYYKFETARPFGNRHIRRLTSSRRKNSIAAAS